MDNVDDIRACKFISNGFNGEYMGKHIVDGGLSSLIFKFKTEDDANKFRQAVKERVIPIKIK